MKKSLPGPRLTRRFGGPSAAAFGGRGGFRLPGSNVRTVAKIDFFSAHTSHAQLQRGLRAQCVGARLACVARALAAQQWQLAMLFVLAWNEAPRSLQLLPRTNCARCPPNDAPLIEVPLSIELVSKVDVQCAMQ